MELGPSIAASSRQRFDESLSELEEVAASISPLHILSMLTCYALMAPVDVAARAGNRPTAGTRVQQGQVEYFQALLLRHELKCHKQPAPPLSQRVFDALPTLFQAHGLMQMPFDVASSDDGLSEAQVAAKFVQSYLRNHTASVRNWGYFPNVKRIAVELLSSLDIDFQQAYGLTLTQLVELFEHLVRRQEKQVSEEHICRVQTVYSANTPAEMAAAFGEQFAEFQGVEEFQAFLKRPGTTVRDAKFAVFMAAESILPSLFIFETEAVAKDLSLSPSVLERILGHLSLSFGALREMPPQKMLLENPVWGRPLIKLDEGVYFCALPQVLMSFVFSIVDDLIKPFQAVQKKLQKRRADYLEGEAEKLMRGAFPGCELIRGYSWKENGVQYESDLAVLYDSTLFLVESKSGRVSWPALRGSPERIVRDVKELIVKPSDQSGRLAGRLQEVIAGASNNPVHDFPLTLKNVRSIVRLSVVLHDFATIQSVPSIMEDAGLIQSDYPLAPCLTLSDLEIVTDLLDTPYLRMHYLRRRAEVLSSVRILGDELDTLGFYLDTSFNLGDIETRDQRLMMVGYSTRVDRYYVYKSEGRETKKPKTNLSPWIRSLCDQLALRRIHGWSELAFQLLCIPRQDQQRIEKELRARQRKIAAGKMPRDGSALILIPPEHRRFGLVFYIKVPDGDTTKNSAQQFANIAFNSEHVELCLVLGFVSNSTDLLYSSISLLSRADRPVQPNTYL